MNAPRRYLIFYCSQDPCWIVAVDQGDDVWLGVAECPELETARTVLEAMRLREGFKERQDSDARAVTAASTPGPIVARSGW